MGPCKPESMGEISKYILLLSCPDAMPAPTAGPQCPGCAAQVHKTGKENNRIEELRERTFIITMVRGKATLFSSSIFSGYFALKGIPVIDIVTRQKANSLRQCHLSGQKNQERRPWGARRCGRSSKEERAENPLVLCVN